MNAVTTRTLRVWCNREQVGTLEEYNNLWHFEYHPDWNGFDLAPDLPLESGRIEDGASRRPVQWFFDNLLPEEGARSLMAKDARVDQADAFGLLTHFGAESAGALTLLHTDELPEQMGETPLEYEALSERIRNLPHVALSTGSSKRMSLAGAQHKLPIICRDGALYEPMAATPSTHILKPEHSDPETYPHTVANEWFVMQLAKRLGLSVPDSLMLQVPQPVYLVERFDRCLQDGELLRRHVLDACQLLSLDRAFKYTQCSLASLDRLISLCRTKAVTRQRLFQWLVFNHLVGNTDDHLKNLSFFVDSSAIELAPHYDLISTALYEKDNGWGQAELVWPIGEARCLGDVRYSDLLMLADALSLSKGYVERWLKNLIKKSRQLADQILAELEAQPVVGVGRAGEMRTLRQLRYGVMEDMIRQLDQTSAK